MFVMERASGRRRAMLVCEGVAPLNSLPCGVRTEAGPVVRSQYYPSRRLSGLCRIRRYCPDSDNQRESVRSLTNRAGHPSVCAPCVVVFCPFLRLLFFSLLWVLFSC